MKVTVQWLKQYVDFDWSVDELAERLTMLGLEVEGIQKVGGGMEGVVVAQVLSREKHPNADRLSLCRVFDGKEERQIVCGASNFQAGDKVALILPGYSLPAAPGEKPLTIRVTKIRGVESQGMLCSEKELGISENHEGIMVLPPDAPVGTPLAQYLGRDQEDYVLDLEITPNRPDLNSVIGVAREIAALTGNPLRIPEVSYEETESPSVEELVAVQIVEPDLCPRYTARVVLGIRVGPSPAWLRWTLEKVGVRSINNVVDITNFVMLESGQPLHAFDYHLIAKGPDGKPTILVRRAAEGEKFTTLDDVERTLSSEDLLIADPEKAIALAGVMGGANTEIRETTQDMLIESACFHTTTIRRTARRHGLQTEASYRFERGVDLPTVDWASRRCAQLIQQLAGGRVARGVVDAYPRPRKTVQITLRHRKVNELLGIELRPEEIEYYLGQLGLKKVSRQATPVGQPQTEPEPVVFEVPSWRPDLKREADLIEEVCRLHGVEKIPAASPRGGLGSHPFDRLHDEIQEVRRILCGLGLDECQGQSLINRTAARLVTEENRLIELERPLSQEMDVLRPSLLPGLLDILRHNHNRKLYDVALFEIGKVFWHSEKGPTEARRLGIALMGRRNPLFWGEGSEGPQFDLFDLKGILETFCEQFGLPELSYRRRPEPTPLFIQSATIHLPNGQEIGQIGQVLPPLARRYDIRLPIFLAELDLETLLPLRRKTPRYQPLPAFPEVRRDVALVVPEEVTHAQILEVLRKAKIPHMERIELFDVYRGPKIPSGHKSLAYAVTYRSRERTLRDEEVNRAHEQLIQILQKELGATVRAS